MQKTIFSNFFFFVLPIGIIFVAHQNVLAKCLQERPFLLFPVNTSGNNFLHYDNHLKRSISIQGNSLNSKAEIKGFHSDYKQSEVN